MNIANNPGTDMTEITITVPARQDLADIVLLYRTVASMEGGLARRVEEITDEYVLGNFTHSSVRGLIFIARAGGQVVGEIHAFRPVPQVFAHVLSDLTIAVHPDYQNRGVGRLLFNALLNTVRTDHPDILRVELIARESNQRAIQFYASLGFEIEGKMRNRIKSVGGGFEADIPMAWHRNHTHP